MHFSYDCAPKALYDQNLINHAWSSMSQSQFEREFGAVFTDDSSGYFKTSTMAKCTVPDGDTPSIEVAGEAGAKYLLAFDPSWAETESSDDFAMQVIKLNDSNKTGVLVHSYALSGSKLKDHINYFHYILKNFNIVAIVATDSFFFNIKKPSLTTIIFCFFKTLIQCFHFDCFNIKNK